MSDESRLSVVENLEANLAAKTAECEALQRDLAIEYERTVAANWERDEARTDLARERQRAEVAERELADLRAAPIIATDLTARLVEAETRVREYEVAHAVWPHIYRDQFHYSKVSDHPPKPHNMFTCAKLGGRCALDRAAQPGAALAAEKED